MGETSIGCAFAEDPEGYLEQALMGTMGCGRAGGDVYKRQVEGDVNDASSAVRFTIESQGAVLPVAYDGGLDERIVDGVAVVVSGHLDSDGNFIATEQPAIDSSITK